MSYIKEVIKQLYEHGGKPFVLQMTGSGSKTIPYLLSSVGGASKLVMELDIPYSRFALQEKIHHNQEIKQYVSEECALDLSRTAFLKAQWIYRNHANESLVQNKCNEALPILHTCQKVLGIGCTAAIVSNYDRKGKHHVYVSSYCNSACNVFYLNMDKEAERSRDQEDDVVSLLVLLAIVEHNLPLDVVKNFETFISENYLQKSEKIVKKTVRAHPLISSMSSQQTQDDIQKFLDALPPFHDPSHQYLLFQHDMLSCSRDIKITSSSSMSDPHPYIIYPGSFDPVHDGHLKLMKMAQQFVSNMHGNNAKIASIFEISIQNADKPSLALHVIMNRLKQFNDLDGGLVVALTKAPFFSQKAQCFPGCYFVVGADTAARLVDKKYYGNDEQKMMRELLKFIQLQCKFIVAGRYDSNQKKFITMDDISGILPCFKGVLFFSIPEKDFREDISSTEIRKRLQSS